MRIVYADDCRCRESDLRISDFRPAFMMADKEQRAANAWTKSGDLLRKFPDTAPRYYAYHVGDRHILYVRP